MRSTFNKAPLPGLQRADRTERHGRSRKGFDEMVATSNDLSRTPVGRAARGGGATLGMLLVPAKLNVELMRTLCQCFKLLFFCNRVADLHREADPTTVGDVFPRIETTILRRLLKA